jgi:hypothetical protein
MREETGLIVCLTRPVGVFGGPDFIIEYQNGHRTSDVMAVFDATSRPRGTLCPDGIEPVSRAWPHRARACFPGQDYRARCRGRFWIDETRANGDRLLVWTE